MPTIVRTEIHELLELLDSALSQEIERNARGALVDPVVSGLDISWPVRMEVARFVRTALGLHSPLDDVFLSSASSRSPSTNDVVTLRLHLKSAASLLPLCPDEQRAFMIHFGDLVEA